MTRFLGIVNGKGGVGKTTTSLNLAFCLKDSYKVILLDGNLTNPHLGLLLGKQNPDFSIHSSTVKKNHVTKAIHDLFGINIVLGRMNMQYNLDNLKETLAGLHSYGDRVIIDCPPGEYRHMLEHCDECILVTTPDPVSVAESFRAKATAKHLGVNVLGVVVNRVNSASHELKINQIERFLGLPILAKIPEDRAILEAQSRQMPVSHYKPRSKASKAYMQLAQYFID